MFKQPPKIFAIRYYVHTSEGNIPISLRSKFFVDERLRQNLWRITNPAELKKMTRFLCKTYRNKDIRLYARQATLKGWKIVANKEENVCTALAKVQKRFPRKAV